ncbi:MAG TPA: hypothetical protein VNZ05_01495, partial [Solirubrobacteraceae bacterium]|nr:hypothetical protein [Solirubrobacteraceae bacterium]
IAAELRGAEQRVGEARYARAQVEGSLKQISERRAEAERALAERAQRHDALAERLYGARTAHERLELRREQTAASKSALEWRLARAEEELRAGGAQGEDERAPVGGDERIASLEAELAQIDAQRQHALEQELSGLREEHARAAQRAAELERELETARAERARADELLAQAREGSVWSGTWQEVRRVIADGLARALAQSEESARAAAIGETAEQAERVARGVVEYALKGVRAAEEARERAERSLREAESAHAEAREAERRAQWLIEQRRAAAEQGPLALRRAALAGGLEAERRALERLEHERAERAERVRKLRERRGTDTALLALAERLGGALQSAAEAAGARAVELQAELRSDTTAGEEMTSKLRACAAEEAEIQARLGSASESVTEVEVAAQRVRDQAGETALELRAIAERLGVSAPAPAPDGPALEQGQLEAIEARVARLERRREQLGPVNPLAQEEYAAAVEHVEEMESRREDLETAMRELRAVISDADRAIQRNFNETFEAAARNFSELAGELFPGGAGSLRLVREEAAPRAVLGGQPLPAGEETEEGDEQESAGEELAAPGEVDLEGVEIEITPAGKSTKRLSLLSGGEKSMTALAFLFAVFLARPCPFYILDEVEAALDDLNLDRFLALLRRYSHRAQFIVITHQKRTMEAADWLYGVSMGSDGVSKVLSRRLPAELGGPAEVAEVA